MFRAILAVACALTQAAGAAAPAATPTAAADRAAPGPVLREVRKIWDAAPHNAFTDLIRFRDRWFCAFREGAKHVSPEAAIRVIASADGATWQSAARIAVPGVDLRDAKLSIMPDGRLMLLGGWRTWPPLAKLMYTTFVAFSADGSTWTEPRRVLADNLWLWRVTWHGGIGYGIAYGGSGPEKDETWQSHLYRTRDGIAYEKVVTFAGWPGLTEATVRFDPVGAAYCLHRRDGGTKTALLGTSAPPYTDWKWRDAGSYFGGPDLIAHEGKWWAAGRLMKGPPKTVLAAVDWERGALEPVLELPSGGDTSYPGLVVHEKELWISYYSSHEKKASIYLARVGLEGP